MLQQRGHRALHGRTAGSRRPCALGKALQGALGMLERMAHAHVQLRDRVVCVERRDVIVCAT